LQSRRFRDQGPATPFGATVLDDGTIPAWLTPHVTHIAQEWRFSSWRHRDRRVAVWVTWLGVAASFIAVPHVDARCADDGDADSVDGPIVGGQSWSTLVACPPSMHAELKSLPRRNFTPDPPESR